ncbi:MAG: cysteine methyltransferase [Acidimicrobiaceae bacterium]|nr:cysteine methyltransferase [Acidimicrobiaceae bacterium]
MTHYATTMLSPIGELTIVANAEAIVAIRWDTESDDRHPDARNPVDGNLGEVEMRDDATTHPVLAAAVEQLTEYFDGARTEFELPLAPIGTEFQRQAWQQLSRIPYGETITYGEQAIRLGDRNKMRAVGAANGKNPIPIVVPCHRVVGADGKLTGFAGGLDNKAWLLDHEFQVRAATS